MGLEVKFESPMSQRYQQQGILVEKDQSDHKRMECFLDGTGLKLFVGTILGASVNTISFVSIPGTSVMYLRLAWVGDEWFPSYSSDGLNWTSTTSFIHDIPVASVGVFAGNSDEWSNTPAHTAVVDYFFNNDSSIVPKDDASAGQGTLNLTVVGGGSVTANPDQATYSCGEQVTLTAIPDPGHVFAGWQDDLTGSNNPEIITNAGDMHVTATFQISN